MNHTQFFTVIKNKALSSCYLLEGEEEFIKQSALNTIKKTLLPQGMEALNETELENPTVSQVVAACETMPFMSEKRLVVIKECDFLSAKGKGDEKELERLMDYLPQMPAQTVLIFYQRGKMDARKKLVQRIKAMDGIVSFSSLSDSELARWMAKTLKAYGKTISFDVANYLMFSVGRDVTLVKGELDKLAAHAGEREEIGKADIDAICSKSMECTVFELTDEIVAGNIVKAMQLLTYLLKTGSDRITILQMMIRQYRILYHLTLMQSEGKPRSDIQKALAIPSFAVERAQKQASAYTKNQLQKAVNRLIETDFKIKSGKLNPEGALENIILNMQQSNAG